MSSGGKRFGAGRPKGELRVKVSAWVLSETAATWRRQAFNEGHSVGRVLDKIFKNKRSIYQIKEA